MKLFFSSIFLLFFVQSCNRKVTDWKVLENTNEASPRHENTFVELDGKFYAIGGRTDRPVEEFDPKTNTWTVLAEVPMNFQHFQAIAFKGEIYVIGAFTGEYPHEKPIPNFLIFNPKTKTWRDGPKIPQDRLRGSVGAFTRGDKIYLVCGIIDGHWDGHVSWFDEYDTKTGIWKILPDAPRPRDHFSATMVGNSVYVAGGRTSHAAIGKVLELTIPEVDFFDFNINIWSTVESKLPTQRAGTSTISNGTHLVVMNGESSSQELAHDEVEVLDTRTGTWSKLTSLNKGRHGTGAIYYQGKIYVVAGSANQYGGPELGDIEYLDWK
jgi:N-acetylneuraminic acid mutarotase